MTVTGDDGGAARQASSGTIELNISQGRVTGVVQGASAEFNATFDGAVSISCWVPDSSPSNTHTAGEESQGEALVQDVDFTTPQCEPFAKFRM